MERSEIFTWAVILYTCAFTCAGWHDKGFEEKCIFWPEAILGRRQYYRLLTAGFLHANAGHLAMNMLSLYFFAPEIEMHLGWRRFLVIYLAAITGGNLLALLVHRQHDYRAYGASGGVAGIILAHIFLFPGGSIGLFLIPIGIPDWLYAIGFLAASFYGMKSRIGRVGHDAHLGGALVGLYTAAALEPSIITDSPKLFAAISIGTILLFLYLARNPLFLPGRDVPFLKPAKTEHRSDLPEYKRMERQIDAILAKISEKGLHSLTPEEEAVLRETSDKYKRRAISEKPKSGLSL